MTGEKKKKKYRVIHNNNFSCLLSFSTRPVRIISVNLTLGFSFLSEYRTILDNTYTSSRVAKKKMFRKHQNNI